MAGINKFPLIPALKDDDLFYLEARPDIDSPYSGYSVSIGQLRELLASEAPLPSTVSLTYVSNGDLNGCLYYLGTNRGREPFSNPMLRGAISITQSTSFQPGTYAPEFLCDRATGVSHTQEETNAWFRIDLIDKTLTPNYYSLRGRTDQYNSNHPRSWKLQGSNDAVNWIDLNSQTNNTTLAQNVWLSIPLANITQGYRYFRILKTGTDSNGLNYFVIGEAELYGELVFPV